MSDESLDESSAIEVQHDRSPDRLVLLANGAIRARRRPVMIVLWWALEAALAYALVYPILAFVRGAYGAHPQGDAPLWSPGALSAFDLAVSSRAALPPIIAHVSVIGLAALVLAIFPLGAFLTSVAYTTPDRRAPPLRRVLGRAARAFPALLVLLVGMTLTELFLAGIALLAGGAASSGFTASMGEARAQQLGAATTLVLLLPMAIVGVLHDLARAAVIRFEVGGIQALRLALNTLRRGVFASAWSWAWRAAIAWVPVAMGAFVAGRLGGKAGGALLAIAALHQLVILARVALRASWLAKAMRLVDDAHRVLKAAR
jgi:hypothetical protein